MLYWTFKWVFLREAHIIQARPPKESARISSERGRVLELIRRAIELTSDIAS